MGTQKISIISRLISGFLFAFAVGITAVCVPIGLLLLTRGKAIQLLGLFKGFPIWESSLLAISAAIGIVLGPDRSMETLGHLWGIEQPRKIALTLGLWACFVAFAVCSYWVFERRHGF